MASEEKFRVALKAVLLKFGIDELKEEQTTILNCLIERHDCMAVLPTGYGKSLPFQMLIPLRMELSQSDLHSSQDLDSMSTINKVEKIIVCCPLISLMKDQVSQLKEIYCAKVAFKGLLAFSSSLILHHDDTKYSRIVGVQVALGLPLSDRNPPRFKRAKGGNYRLKRGIQVPLNKPSSVNNEIENDGIIKRIKRKTKKDKDEKEEESKEDKTKLYLILFLAGMFVLLFCAVFGIFCCTMM